MGLPPPHRSGGRSDPGDRIHGFTVDLTTPAADQRVDYSRRCCQGVQPGLIGARVRLAHGGLLRIESPAGQDGHMQAPMPPQDPDRHCPSSRP